MVQFWSGRAPFAGQLIRERHKGPKFVGLIAPDVLRPRHDEPLREHGPGTSGEQLHDAEVILEEVVTDRRQIWQTRSRDDDRGEPDERFRPDGGDHWWSGESVLKNEGNHAESRPQ